MNEIGAAISSLATIKNLIESAFSMRDEAKALEVKLALMQQMFEVQRALSALQAENAKLLQENRALKEAQRNAEQFAADVQGHELFEAAPSVFVYALEPSDGGRHKQPYFCHPCHKERKHSILSFEKAKAANHPAVLQCIANALHRFELPQGWKREHFKNGPSTTEARP